MADLSDRHYALFANNQHPLQLNAYQQYNRFLRTLHDKGEAERDDRLYERMSEVVADRESHLKKSEGESLSTDDLQDIYIQVAGEQRAVNKMTANSMTKTGEINDYLEFRRPFGTGQWV